MLNKQMNVVVFTVHFHQGRFEIRTDPKEYVSEPFQRIVVEYSVSVLGNKDQVNVHGKNTVPSLPNLLISVHRPS